MSSESRCVLFHKFAICENSIKRQSNGFGSRTHYSFAFLLAELLQKSSGCLWRHTPIHIEQKEQKHTNQRQIISFLEKTMNKLPTSLNFLGCVFLPLQPPKIQRLPVLFHALRQGMQPRIFAHLPAARHLGHRAEELARGDAGASEATVKNEVPKHQDVSFSI